ncbi:hypothetical protein D6745_01785 [Candidatus Woesearchaeota archaeon]|nr:MAG: hypothetical protein D6745_01785 [Candidatus Woesearchaeota archaeon]
MARPRKKEGLFSKKNVITFIIVFIMISSAAGFIFSGSDRQTYEYNNIKYSYLNNAFVFKINGKKVYFRNDPEYIENIKMDSKIVDSVLNTKVVYLTYNPFNNLSGSIDLARYEISEDLANDFDIYTVNGAVVENQNLPLITCGNATESIPVIEMRKSNETRITMNENCIIFEAKTDFEMLELKDRLMYGLYGIIK